MDRLTIDAHARIAGLDEARRVALHEDVRARTGSAAAEDLLARRVALHALAIALCPAAGAPRSLTAPLAHTLADSVAGSVDAALALALPDLFIEAFPAAERRRAGQYWTPDPIADFLATWAIGPGTRSVLDPAAGTGQLVAAAHNRISDCNAQATIEAVEIDPVVAAVLTAWSARALGVPYRARTGDFLTGPQGAHDAIVANPPYTRHQQITPEAKRAYAQAISSLGLTPPSGQAGLHAYFLLSLIGHLAPGGRLALITPSEIYDARSAGAVRDAVLGAARLRAVAVFAPGIRAFPGVDATGAISLIEQGEPDGRPIARIELTSWPGTEQMMDALDRGISGATTWGHIEQLPPETLSVRPRWLAPRRPRRRPLPHQVSLAEIATVRRGVATGNNAFFLLSDADVAAHRIPARYLTPIVTRARDVPHLTFTDEDRQALRAAGRDAWLLSVPESAEDQVDEPAVRSYLERGRADGVADGALVRQRRVWFRSEQRTAPDFLVPCLFNGEARIIANRAGVVATNAFHHLTVLPEISADEQLLEAFAAIVNAPAVLDGLTQVGRSYGGKTIKVEPRELDRLLVTDPRDLTATQVRALGVAFRRAARCDGEHRASARDVIDAILRDA